MLDDKNSTNDYLLACDSVGVDRDWDENELEEGLMINTCPVCLTEFKSPSSEGNLMPPFQGKRDTIRPRYDLIPQQWLEALAKIFEEGQRPRPGLPEGYGDSWKQGGPEYLKDCLNHAQHHLLLYYSGDRSEDHLAKVAWNVLAVHYHNLILEVPKSGSR